MLGEKKIRVVLGFHLKSKTFRKESRKIFLVYVV